MAGKRQKRPGTTQGHRPQGNLILMPSRGAAHTWTADELGSLTRDALRAMAVQRALSPSGLKADIVARLLAADREFALPPLPAVTWPAGTDWHPWARERWNQMWSSDVAGSWDRAGDGGALTRYIFSFDRWMKLSELMVGKEMVRGSRGQVRANPLFGVLATLAVELKLAEEKFGLTPLDRMRLGIEIGGAAQGMKTAEAPGHDAGTPAPG